VHVYVDVASDGEKGVLVARLGMGGTGMRGSRWDVEEVAPLIGIV
jgi:hypothetical protein